MIRNRLARARRAVAYVTLAALLAVLSLTLAQCTMVGDSLTGVKGLSGGSPTTCTGMCRVTYHNNLSVARKTHQAVLSACRALADPKPCIDTENVHWDQVQAQLKAAYDACVANCHKQGAGFGG